MILKKRFNIISNKKGMYILEAAITLPVFIIAVFLLIFIIPAIKDFEETVYISCDTLKLESMKAAFAEDKVSGPVIAAVRIKKKKNFRSSYDVKGYRYLFSKGDIDDLIELKYSSRFSANNPLGHISRIKFEEQLITRGFTGKYNRSIKTSREDFLKGEESKKVYIFPENGRKYHNKKCKHLGTSCRRMVLTDNIRKKYKGCKLCKSKNIKKGDVVYCFENSGRVYHRGNCSSVDRFYIEIEKEVAKKKGYQGCVSCGG